MTLSLIEEKRANNARKLCIYQRRQNEGSDVLGDNFRYRSSRGLLNRALEGE